MKYSRGQKDHITVNNVLWHSDVELYRSAYFTLLCLFGSTFHVEP